MTATACKLYLIEKWKENTRKYSWKVKRFVKKIVAEKFWGQIHPFELPPHTTGQGHFQVPFLILMSREGWGSINEEAFYQHLPLAWCCSFSKSTTHMYTKHHILLSLMLLFVIFRMLPTYRFSIAQNVHAEIWSRHQPTWVTHKWLQ